MTTDQRMDERFPCEVVVDLVWNRQRTRLHTVNLGYRGLFLRTDTPPQLRQLLRLEVPLPDGETLGLHGMAVHVVKVGESDAPGVGVQFYAVDKDTASRWGRFVDQARKRGAPARVTPPGVLPTFAASQRVTLPELAGAPVAVLAASLRETLPELAREGRVASGPVPITAARPKLGALHDEPSARQADPVRRRFVRYDAELELEVRSMEELHRLVSRDVSAGGMFIATDAPIAVGEALRIVVRHPVRPETFDLDAVVRHRAGSPQGIGVEFVDLDDARRGALMEFLRPGLPTEEILLIDADDPQLR